MQLTCYFVIYFPWLLEWQVEGQEFSECLLSATPKHETIVRVSDLQGTFSLHE